VEEVCRHQDGVRSVDISRERRFGLMQRRACFQSDLDVEQALVFVCGATAAGQRAFSLSDARAQDTWLGILEVWHT
jgi:hypothetical protein